MLAQVIIDARVGIGRNEICLLYSNMMEYLKFLQSSWMFDNHDDGNKIE